MTFQSIIQNLLEILLSVAVPIILSLAIVYFLFGVLKYIISAGDESKRKESVKVITMGIIAIFVMVSVWGLVSFITSTFGVSVGIPQFRNFSN
jgi:hypothetical protein